MTGGLFLDGFAYVIGGTSVAFMALLAIALLAYLFTTIPGIHNNDRDKTH